MLITFFVFQRNQGRYERDTVDLQIEGQSSREVGNYLGAQVMQKVVGEVECWAMTSEQYVKAAIANVEFKLDESGQRLPTRCATPVQGNYRPEMDTSPEFKIEGVRSYQELIGVPLLGSGAWTNRHCCGSFNVIYSPSVAKKRTLTAGILHVRIF